MRLTPVRTVAPATAPVSLEEARAHLGVEQTGHDDLIAGLIDAATAHMDGWTGILGRALVTQEWRAAFASFDRVLHLPLAPVQAVRSIRYFDAGGCERAHDPDGYRLLADAGGAFVEPVPGRIWPAAAGRADAVSVEFVCGYGDRADVPGPVRQAILLMVGHLHENRGDGSAAMPVAVRYLIAPYARSTI